MENNFIQRAASAGHALVYTIDPMFKHIIDWVSAAVFRQWLHEYCPFKTTEYFLKFLFLFESTILPVAYTIGLIFKHIIDCVQLYFTNGFTNTYLLT